MAKKYDERQITVVRTIRYRIVNGVQQMISSKETGGADDDGKIFDFLSDQFTIASLAKYKERIAKNEVDSQERG